MIWKAETPFFDSEVPRSIKIGLLNYFTLDALPLHKENYIHRNCLVIFQRAQALLPRACMSNHWEKS